MKKILNAGLILLSFTFFACDRGGTTTRVTTSDNNMRIEIKDYEENPPIEFEKDYDITGMDSAQQKELIARVFDSLGHGKYK